LVAAVVATADFFCAWLIDKFCGLYVGQLAAKFKAQVF
jgi:hypothetical protein